MKEIILASASPRRKEILEQVGINPTIIVSNAVENTKANTPAEYVEKLSFLKAENVANQIKEKEEFVLIAADTVVVKDNKILEKPVDEEDAHRILSSLQGNVHKVFTGVTLIVNQNGKMLRDTFSVCTEVEMLPMTTKQIMSYIATKEPMDKAGAYGIQGKGGMYIRQIRGDYYNVVGLPISAVMMHLKDMGILI